MIVSRTFFSMAVIFSVVGFPAAAADLDAGRDLYARHCAVCHGTDGRGAGPLAEAMKIKPADLTELTARNGGVYPRGKVQDVIRNGGNVLGHGSSQMLAWGLVFSEKFKPEAGRARIGALASYLESLQTQSKP